MYPYASNYPHAEYSNTQQGGVGATAAHAPPQQQSTMANNDEWSNYPGGSIGTSLAAAPPHFSSRAQEASTLHAPPPPIAGASLIKSKKHRKRHTPVGPAGLFYEHTKRLKKQSKKDNNYHEEVNMNDISFSQIEEDDEEDDEEGNSERRQDERRKKKKTERIQVSSLAWAAMQCLCGWCTPTLLDNPSLHPDENSKDSNARRYEIVRRHTPPHVLLLSEIPMLVDRTGVWKLTPGKSLFVMVENIVAHHWLLWTVTLKDETGFCMQAWCDPNLVEEEEKMYYTDPSAASSSSSSAQNAHRGQKFLQEGHVWELQNCSIMLQGQNDEEEEGTASGHGATTAAEDKDSLERMLLVGRENIQNCWTPRHLENIPDRQYMSWVEARSTLQPDDPPMYLSNPNNNGDASATVLVNHGSVLEEKKNQDAGPVIEPRVQSLHYPHSQPSQRQPQQSLPENSLDPNSRPEPSPQQPIQTMYSELDNHERDQLNNDVQALRRKSQEDTNNGADIVVEERRFEHASLEPSREVTNHQQARQEEIPACPIETLPDSTTDDTPKPRADANNNTYQVITDYKDLSEENAVEKRKGDETQQEISQLDDTRLVMTPAAPAETKPSTPRQSDAATNRKSSLPNRENNENNRQPTVRGNPHETAKTSSSRTSEKSETCTDDGVKAVQLTPTTGSKSSSKTFSATKSPCGGFSPLMSTSPIPLFGVATKIPDLWKMKEGEDALESNDFSDSEEDETKNPTELVQKDEKTSSDTATAAISRKTTDDDVISPSRPTAAASLLFSAPGLDEIGLAWSDDDSQ